MEIRKCDGRTDGRTDRLTWVGARDACASKNALYYLGGSFHIKSDLRWKSLHLLPNSSVSLNLERKKLENTFSNTWQENTNKQALREIALQKVENPTVLAQLA